MDYVANLSAHYLQHMTHHQWLVLIMVSGVGVFAAACYPGTDSRHPNLDRVGMVLAGVIAGVLLAVYLSWVYKDRMVVRDCRLGTGPSCIHLVYSN